MTRPRKKNLPDRFIDADVADPQAKAKVIYRTKIPADGTPDWDAYPGADAEYYDVLLQPTAEMYRAAPITERSRWKYPGKTGITAKGFWLDDLRHFEEWFVALEAINERRDMSALLKLLKRGEVASPEIQKHLAAALGKFKLIRLPPGRGRPAAASYDKSAKRAQLLLAREIVKEHCANGIGRAEAIENALLILAHRDYRLRGDKRDGAIEAAEKSVGITLSSLANDLQRGRRYASK